MTGKRLISDSIPRSATPEMQQHRHKVRLGHHSRGIPRNVKSHFIVHVQLADDPAAVYWDQSTGRPLQLLYFTANTALRRDSPMQRHPVRLTLQSILQAPLSTACTVITALLFFIHSFHHCPNAAALRGSVNARSIPLKQSRHSVGRRAGHNQSEAARIERHWRRSTLGSVRLHPVTIRARYSCTQGRI